jgi:hypothetical protein
MRTTSKLNVITDDEVGVDLELQTQTSIIPQRSMKSFPITLVA